MFYIIVLKNNHSIFDFKRIESEEEYKKTIMDQYVHKFNCKSGDIFYDQYDECIILKAPNKFMILGIGLSKNKNKIFLASILNYLDQ
jgi:hypothetical protein